MSHFPAFINTAATVVSGLRGSAPAWYSAGTAPASPVCCILAEEQMLEGFEQDLELFGTRPVYGYPGYEIPPYTPLSPDQRTTALRLATLYRVMENRDSFVLVISVEALLRRVMPKHLLQKHAELVLAGEDCDLETLRRSLVTMGYEQASLVKSFGDFSVRGGVVDLYPPPFSLADGTLHDGPIRLDFFGDTVESIRPFDPLSQRSAGEIDEAVLLPVSDVLLSPANPAALNQVCATLQSRGEELDWEAEKTCEITERVQHGQRFPGVEFFLPLFAGPEHPPSSTVLDYLPASTALVFIEPAAIEQQVRLVLERIEANYRTAARQRVPALPPEELFVQASQFYESCAPFNQAAVTDFVPEGGDCLHVQTTNHQLLKQEISLHRKKQGLLPPLAAQIATWLEADERVIICCRSAHRQKTLADLLNRYPFETAPLDPPLELDALGPLPSQPTLFLCNQPLSNGFSLPRERLHLLSEHELFGEMRLGRRKRRHQAAGEPVAFTELQLGDIVVHRDHGLGMYRGLETIELQGITNDFMHLEYRDGDKLYLPVDRLNLVSRYEGLSDKQPRIDKLGSQSWQTTKKKVSDEVWKVAQELLDIYAKRALKNGRSFSAPGEFYQELEESFPFDETDGQHRAINETIGDLLSEKPMDRLICGDVGYGKTEVAVRAAFKVVEDGFQVAILVPTTVLAEQHVKTFRERLSGFPVQIDCLNRFRTRAEQKRIIGQLEDGSIDIVIGTHRLLSKDVRFQHLGLLIIDEEHRFGVSHKEKIKRIKAEVDVLTLTATPIPRTLQLSLLGIRDLSVISTPPEHRRPIKTFVARYDDLVIKEAVSRELVRGGQVFVVHNRVKSIGRMAAHVQKLVPQARIAVAHGQMAGKDLEEIMVSFVNRRIDVLISTTIIESGLDIPSANTIIINRADRLGLAEIYQLRGRVGRSSTQSFAYLLVPSLDHLSKDSRERLRALMEYNELGGGFKLAMSDLQIRGGGNLLGVSQSGHIAAIGYDLYLDLLQKTVADLKARQEDDRSPADAVDLDPEINIRLSAYIPENYIADIGQRYVMYRRIAALARNDEQSTEELQNELLDRYGPIPEEVHNLLRLMSIKKALLPLRIEKLEQGPNNLVFSFRDDTPVKPERLSAYLQTHAAAFRLTPDGRFIADLDNDSSAAIFEAIETNTRQLQTLTHDHAT